MTDDVSDPIRSRVESALRVLVVDDDFAVAALHRRQVESMAGFEVVGEAYRGEVALAEVERLLPDLVLLDVYLPDLSGVEVLRRIRANPACASVDVMALTASKEVETVRAAMTGGVSAYLIKPFTLAVLRDRLTTYAATRRELLRAEGEAGVRDQDQVDRILASRLSTPAAAVLPKGLSSHTLALVEQVLRDAPGELTAGEAAGLAGLSRVSARRYLEYLASQGSARVRPRYGSAGRPEHAFEWTAH